MLHRKGQKKYWTDLSLLGQEPTFNVKLPRQCPGQGQSDNNSYLYFHTGELTNSHLLLQRCLFQDNFNIRLRHHNT